MRRLVAVLAAVAFALAACGASSSGSATPDPTLAFCPALDTYAKSLATLEAVAETNSVEDYTKALANAKVALAALRAVAGPFAGAQIDTLQTAQLQLEAAAADAPAERDPSGDGAGPAGSAPERHRAGRADLQRHLQHQPDTVGGAVGDRRREATT